jgi:hypothetical protein
MWTLKCEVFWQKVPGVHVSEEFVRRAYQQCQAWARADRATKVDRSDLGRIMFLAKKGSFGGKEIIFNWKMKTMWVLTY